MTKRVCVIPGDDAAPEAVAPTVWLLEQLRLDLELIQPPSGRAAIEQSGHAFPDELRRAIDESDTTLFGATNGTTEGIAYLRWGKDTYANVRPCRYYPGFRSPLAHPEGIDYLILRENLEDLYVAAEGDLRQLEGLDLRHRYLRTPLAAVGPGTFAVKVITEAGSRRVAG